MTRHLANSAAQLRDFAFSLEKLRAEQAKQRRRLAALAMAALAGLCAGWLIDLAFTVANAARIAVGW